METSRSGSSRATKRSWRPRDWTIAQKLWASFGALFLLIVLGGGAAHVHVRQVAGLLHKVVHSDESLLTIILEMEINTAESARAVLHYAHDLDPRHVESRRDAQADFRKYIEAYDRVVSTSEFKRHGREIATLYARWSATGDAIITLVDRRREVHERFRRLAKNVDRLIDEEIPAIEGSGLEAVKKLEAALEMEINSDEAVTVVEGYIGHPDPELRRELADAEKDFAEYEAMYRRTGVDDHEQKWLAQVGVLFRNAATVGRETMDLTDELVRHLDRFEAENVLIDHYVDEEIQPLILAASARAQADARAAIRRAGLILLIVSAAGLLIAGLSAWALSRGILRPVARLMTGTGRIAAGILDHRIEVETKDEFGLLAGSFNRMTEDLAASREARHKYEERLRVQADDLRSLNEMLARSNRELEQFASVASHDLQEPLRKVQAFGDRLKTKYGAVLDEQGLGYIERMQAASSRMSTLVNDLLTFSRVSTKGRPFVAVDLDGIAREVVSDLEVSIEESGAEIDIQSLPTIEADPMQMRQLLQNLIGNAVKYRRDGVSPRIRVEAEVLENGLSAAHGARVESCRLSVTDNGIGFEEQYAERIFGVFQRLHGRGRYGGTGIGLALCKKICERHGGTIAATGRPGEGSTFITTLPMSHS